MLSSFELRSTVRKIEAQKVRVATDTIDVLPRLEIRGIGTATTTIVPYEATKSCDSKLSCDKRWHGYRMQIYPFEDFLRLLSLIGSGE